MRTKPQVRGQIGRSGRPALACTRKIYTIFEGTSEIQRLVISRAISGMRIR
jgi:alkylation response protein AidB-like acyl-CoA dehydrogenase